MSYTGFGTEKTPLQNLERQHARTKSNLEKANNQISELNSSLEEAKAHPIRFAVKQVINNIRNRSDHFEVGTQEGR
jgi:hypothetical protein